jgi:apolipoprotein N-acyltransferase
VNIVEIFEIFKYLSVVFFGILVLLSISGKSRDGFFLGAVIVLVVNFWIRAKLGENPNILEYLAAMVIYVSCIVVTIKLEARKKVKPLDPRYPAEG